MGKINYMQKKVKSEFSIEEFFGMINRRDNIVIVAKMLESNYKEDDMIKMVCRFMDKITDTFDTIGDKIGSEINKVMIEDDLPVTDS